MYTSQTLRRSVPVIMLVLFILMTSREASAQVAAKADSTEEEEEPVLNFYGSGNIQKALEGEDALPANTGLGVNYYHTFTGTPSRLAKYFRTLEIDASINVASTVDTLEAEYDTLTGQISNSSNFGSSILTPLNSGQAVKLCLRMDFKGKLFGWFIDGLKIKYVGSNRNWNIKDTVASVERFKVFQVTNNYFRAGLFQEFLPEKYLNDYSINFGLYFAYNSIKGDIGLRSNGELREETIGTKKRNFMGPEVALEIKLKNLRAEFGYSFLGAGREVPGLTSGRLITTISFVGGFPLKLDPKKKKGSGSTRDTTESDEN
jgi:hypothetical protein